MNARSAVAPTPPRAPTSRRPRAAAALGLALAGALLGCDAPAAQPDVAALEQRFPAQAARVLAGTAAFSPGAEGFAVAGHEAGPHGLSATLPLAGDGAARIAAGTGLEVRVREPGARGAGALAGGAVAYARPGGTSYWSARGDGYEEWLALDAGAAEGGGPVAVWEVEGAALRQAGAAIEICDALGVARLRVTAPEAFAAGGGPLAAELRAEGSRIELRVARTSAAVLVDPRWTGTGKLAEPRYSHASARLPSGKVLVAGGFGNGTLASAELYDPATGTWAAAAPMATARYYPGYVQLGDGRLLVIGGQDGTNTIKLSAELYDPATNQWSPAGTLAGPREFFVTVLLADGRALVAGGDDGSKNLATVEIYDPAKNGWKTAASMSTPREFCGAATLPDQRVIVFAGSQFGVLKSSELYDPKADAWKPGPDLAHGRLYTSVITLADGRVLVVGGDSSGASVLPAEIYDPQAGAWKAAGSLGTGRELGGLAPLPDGTVLAAGGQSAASTSLASSEIFDPVALAWAPTRDLGTPRSQHSLTALGNGRTLAAGGIDGNGAALDTSELFTQGNPGDPCAGPADCKLGFCAGAVCCDRACGANGCEACTKAGGASADGTCTPLSNVACDDEDVCTRKDTCAAGVCAGTTITCVALDDCHAAGICDKVKGCSTPQKPDGSACAGGTCAQGKCVLSDGGLGGGGAGGSGGGAGHGGAGGEGGRRAAGSGGAPAPGGPAAPTLFASGGCAASGRGEAGAWLTLPLLLLAARRRRRGSAASG